MRTGEKSGWAIPVSSEEDKTIGEFKRILEEAYLNGHDVRLQDIVAGRNLVIECQAIPAIVQMFIGVY